jgi:hypothetical protein
LKSALEIATAIAKGIGFAAEKAEKNEMRKEIADDVELTYRRRMEANEGDSIEGLVSRNTKPKKPSFFGRLRNLLNGK